MTGWMAVDGKLDLRIDSLFISRTPATGSHSPVNHKERPRRASYGARLGLCFRLLSTSTFWRAPALSGFGNWSRQVHKHDYYSTTNWSAADNGIYFIRFNEYTDGEGTILFYDFSTAHVKEIAKLGRHHILCEGLTVSADRRSFFYNVWEHPGGDFMLADNSR